MLGPKKCAWIRKELHVILKERAKTNNRTLEEEINSILEKEFEEEPTGSNDSGG